MLVAAGFAMGWFARPLLSDPPDPQLQEGTLSLPDKEAHDIFYPRPFARPPNLTVGISSGDLVVVEQRADGFKVRVNRIVPPISNYPWRARGMLAH
jgi:hypothetical protein